MSKLVSNFAVDVMQALVTQEKSHGQTELVEDSKGGLKSPRILRSQLVEVQQASKSAGLIRLTSSSNRQQPRAK